MQLDIITADKNLFSGDVDVVTLPGTDGSFQILNRHAAMISSLIKGKIIAKGKDGIQEFEVNGGIVEVLNNKVIILA
ncbi:MAG: F0F1 ATP synthase subunit epsilon [Bacteroidia bacterium]|nr:F0F1 ATP synthase subunit epsilon [Bacteroidia bacterium]